jgi:hypothetical protein
VRALHLSRDEAVPSMSGLAFYRLWVLLWAVPFLVWVLS